ncbi:UDP-N-acetylmuramoyl-tripeptide--D-alanyl-D-alanine ligase [Desulfurispira natronophila]|uniref:UDP-N-acetylmuramoyl-tripeptide--D-alanyl-D-alanine ligase n=1 Tax=Desulfurispira natronophila TaxID=682562 RepID=A0A7W7Y514_9BACT|nr:UDP-N-acetylmuramoyl-tripeptide--D-alanyl-D-alanine ligase [Desulfurispira natronophila]MBB5022220.1 UDP-N-acetylmuramoyl-tripeptide--D-alanyl-D-alanine ligase [Desulfurispira natronophila]
MPRHLSTLSDLACLIPATTITGNPQTHFRGFAIDSRTLKPGELFVAIASDSDDGHRYVPDAFSKGATAALIHHLQFSGAQELIAAGKPLLQVPNTLQALTGMARAWRCQWSFPVVAVTGSAGKTTLCSMLSRFSPATAATLGNFNNYIGLPLSILSAPQDALLGVFELGMNGFGEIDTLGSLLQPQVGVITNIGSAHMGLLGGRQGIMEAKLELLPHCDTLVVDGDNTELVHQAAAATHLVTAGSAPECTVRLQHQEATDTGTLLQVEFDGSSQGSHKFLVPFAEAFLIKNALLALATGHTLGLPRRKMEDALQKASLPRWRWEQHHIGSHRYIFDCYNSNPDSLQAALQQLSRLPGPHIAVVGEMLELGEFSEIEHRNAAAFLQFCQHVFTYGTQAQWISEELGNQATHCHSIDQIAAELADCQSATVLVKGSRGNRLERLLDVL